MVTGIRKVFTLERVLPEMEHSRNSWSDLSILYIILPIVTKTDRAVHFKCVCSFTYKQYFEKLASGISKGTSEDSKNVSNSTWSFAV